MTADQPDPYRVDPAGHRGYDVGILDWFFELPRDRHDDDPRGPRPIDREGPGR